MDVWVVGGTGNDVRLQAKHLRGIGDPLADGIRRLNVVRIQANLTTCTQIDCAADPLTGAGRAKRVFAVFRKQLHRRVGGGCQQQLYIVLQQYDPTDWPFVFRSSVA